MSKPAGSPVQRLGCGLLLGAAALVSSHGARAQSVPVVAAHLWIAAHRRVTLVGSAPGRLKVQKVLSFPLAQTVSAWGPCTAFTLTPGTAPGWSSAGDARAYVLKQGTLDVFDE